MGKKGLGSRGAGYGLTVVVNAAIAIAIIPAVVHRAGAQQWTGIAVSQAVASLFAVVVGYGWGVVGPSRVAVAARERDRQTILNSIVIRLVLLLALLPLYVYAVYRSVPQEASWTVGAIAGLSVLLPPCGASWYFVGRSDPLSLLAFDTLPRAAGALFGVLVVLANGGLVWFAILLATGSAFSVLVGNAIAFRRAMPADLKLTVNVLTGALVQYGSGVLTAISQASFVNLPLFALSTLGISGVSEFALADKLKSFALSALNPLVQVAQGSVGEGAQLGGQSAMVWKVAKLGLLSGVVSGALFAPSVVFGGSLLSAGSIQIGWSIAGGMGLVVGAVLATSIVGNACLVALGNSRQLARLNVIGALAGVPLVVLAALKWGAVGTAWTMGGVQCLVCLGSVAAVRREV